MLESLPRIVSLLPAATEIVCALGGASGLLGVSHECDFPDAARGLPVLTASRVGNDSSSAAIDAAVRALVHDALSIYSVDEARLAALAPDLILTQDLCQVCAVSLDDVRRAVGRLAQREDVQIVSLRPTRLEHVWQDIETIAAALGRPERGQALRQELEGRVRRIAVRASAASARPRVASVEWLAPLMLGGTWMPELISLAGGEPLGASAGEPAPTVTPAELLAMKPDVVVVKPCGFDLARTLRERELLESAVLGSVPAHCRVYATDGNAFFNRPGPRLVESLEILAACIQPELFQDFALKHARVLLALAARGHSQ
ncbi:MAG TPA: ABC transporter substrate-binding protein [Polyangiaceae bacterium]|jgi:iron complex transport system substrate-binding protein|nr:ABC transporter substrate-binding protein [Polyangiaceae bacterium]